MSTREHEIRHRSRCPRIPKPNPSVLSRIRRERSRSPRQKPREKKEEFSKGWETEERVYPHAQTATTSTPIRDTPKRSQKVRTVEAGIGSQDQESKNQVDPFTPRIRYFDFPKTRMPNHIKTYDGRNTRVWFDDLPSESIDIYDDLKKAFLENYLQQKKCIKDPIELHNIKQRDEESTEDFVRRYKLESRDVKGAPDCMKISGFVHGITKPELIKRLHDKILKTVDERMRVTISFLRGEGAASNHERKKSFPPWKKQEGNQKQNFRKGSFRNQQRPEKKHDRFTLLTKTPKEIFALEKEKFKAPPPMATPVEKRNHAKFCEFHGEVGHNIDECMHLKKQIEEMLKAGKLSHIIKELKQSSGKEQPKVAKKGETFGKDKALTLLMVQPWERVARQRITQSFSSNLEIPFPPLGEDKGAESPMIIEAEIEGHCIHRMYVDGGSTSEILYEHCFSRLRLEIKNQLAPATTPLVGFSSEIIWSPSSYNGIIGRLGSSRTVPLECAVVSGPEGNPPATKQAVEERVKVAINLEYSEQTIMIGSTLIEEGRNKLCGLLQHNLDIFSWKPADMIGVPRYIAEYRLNVREGCSPVRQKKWGQEADRNQAIQ
ncbi:reverse transcriptase domain-containing protein [Tanacetum coccineum]